MAVYERIAARTRTAGEYMGFLSNDAALAARYGSTVKYCSKQGGAGVACGEYTVRETKLFGGMSHTGMG